MENGVTDMADVFISYKREDKHLAEDVISRLKDAGLSVWYDERITPHTSWDETIEAEIAAARAVVVLWTPRSVTSEWVRTEADYAKEHNKMVPVKLEACSPPLAYRRMQTADLTNWDGNPADRNWQKALGWVKGLIAGTSNGPGNVGPATAEELGYAPRSDNRGGMGLLLSAIAIMLVAGAGLAAADMMDVIDISEMLGQEVESDDDNDDSPSTQQPTVQASATPIATPTLQATPIPTPVPTPSLTAKPTPTPKPTPTMALTAPPTPSPPMCFNVQVTASEKDQNGKNWDIPVASPDIKVKSRTHPRVRFDCTDRYTCNRDGFANIGKQLQIHLSIVDDDFDADDKMGAGFCTIPATDCKVGLATVQIKEC